MFFFFLPHSHLVFPCDTCRGVRQFLQKKLAPQRATCTCGASYLLSQRSDFLRDFGYLVVQSGLFPHKASSALGWSGFPLFSFYWFFFLFYSFLFLLVFSLFIFVFVFSYLFYSLYLFSKY
jgi:hypothetical protein